MLFLEGISVDFRGTQLSQLIVMVPMNSSWTPELVAGSAIWPAAAVIIHREKTECGLIDCDPLSSNSAATTRRYSLPNLCRSCVLIRRFRNNSNPPPPHMTTTVRTTPWGEAAVPALPDEETQELPPPEGAESCPAGWIYGYKLLSNADPSSPEYEQVCCKLAESWAVIDLARYAAEPNHWVFVYLAVFDEAHGVFGLENGTSRIPGPEHLAKLEQEIGAEGGPRWYPHIPGTIFPMSNTLNVVIRTWHPRTKDRVPSSST
ncbi:hypothetical protein HMN09_01167300 [Mycena chlorophos]|uniref:Uncharacterized protein n=1 Tax=Mycena chlorophos TaxID=658473 RepID=A0A8H6S7B5_MYCCL|nr:hypothetical protein HMN09_01167300 [Mycena chlorophos]